MFDVIWTDPSIEKVGDRKARKEKEHGSQDGEDARLSKRGSTSTRCSSSSADKSVMTRSTADKASSWFGSASLKKNRLSSRSKVSRASDLRIPIPEANTVTPSLPTASTFCPSFSADASPEYSRVNMDAQDLTDPIKTSWDGSKDSQTLPPRESSSSRSTQGAAPFFQSPFESPQGNFAADFTAQPRAKVVQTFGADRWIRKTTETFIEVKSETRSDCAISEITVPSARVLADPHTPDSLIPLDQNLSTDIIPNRMHDLPPPVRSAFQTPSRLPGPIRSRKAPGSLTKTSLRPPPTTGLIKFRAHDPSSWKAPEEWEIEDRQAEAARALKAEVFNLEEQFSAVDRPGNESLVDLASVQREINKMAMLVPASIVFRLDEEVAESQDSSAYRETELERKRLMLYALGALGRPRQSGSSARPDKILALFETEAAASYLAAMHPESSITHLSPSPLSALLFPNVRPLVSPAVTNSALALAPNYFSAVYCLGLPSILSSQEIPGLLSNICACLLPGGILHLVLINPAPTTRSFGPRMRQWMEDNLLLNLERQFRCTNPRKLIPMWLGDAGLRTSDITKTTVKCQAVIRKTKKAGIEEIQDQRQGDGCTGKKRTKTNAKADDDEEEMLDLLYGGHEAAKREQQAKLELQSRIGRLLWQETWGSYVNADRWWWDDPECVEECAQLGTYWEYSIIEAVKDR